MADVDTSYTKMTDLYNKYGIPLTSLEAFLPFLLDDMEGVTFDSTNWTLDTTKTILNTGLNLSKNVKVFRNEQLLKPGIIDDKSSEPVITNDYAISGNNIIFAEPLKSTETKSDNQSSDKNDSDKILVIDKGATKFLDNIVNGDAIYEWLINNKFLTEDKEINPKRQLTLQDTANFANFVFQTFNNEDITKKKYRVADFFKIGTQQKGDAYRNEITNLFSKFNSNIEKLRRNNIVYGDNVEKQLSKYLSRSESDNQSLDKNDSDYKAKLEKGEAASSFNEFRNYVSNTLNSILTTDEKIAVDESLKSQVVEAIQSCINDSKDKINDADKSVLDSIIKNINGSKDVSTLKDYLEQAVSKLYYIRNPYGGQHQEDYSGDSSIDSLIKNINTVIPGIDISNKYISKMGYLNDYKKDMYLLQLNMVHLLSAKFNAENRKDNVDKTFDILSTKLQNLPGDINGKISELNAIMKSLSDLDWCVNDETYKGKYDSLKNQVKELVQNDDTILTSLINKVQDDYKSLISDAPVKISDNNLMMSTIDSLVRYLDFNIDFLNEVSESTELTELKEKIQSSEIFKDREKVEPEKLDDNIVSRIRACGSNLKILNQATGVIKKKVNSLISKFRQIHTYNVDDLLDFITKDLNNLDENSENYKELQKIKDSFYVQTDDGRFVKRQFRPGSEDFRALIDNIKGYYAESNKSQDMDDFGNLSKSYKLIDILLYLPEPILTNFVDSLDNDKLKAEYEKSSNKHEFLIDNLDLSQINLLKEFLESKQPKLLEDLKNNLFNKSYNDFSIKQYETELPSTFKTFNPPSAGGVSGYKKQVFENVNELDYKNYINKFINTKLSTIELQDINGVIDGIKKIKELIDNTMDNNKEFKNKLLSKRYTSEDLKSNNSIVAVLPTIINQLGTPVSVKELLTKLDTGELQDVVSKVDFHSDVDNYLVAMNQSFNAIVSRIKELNSEMTKIDIGNVDEQISKEREEKFRKRIPDHRDYELQREYDVIASKVNTEKFLKLAELSQFTLNDLNTVLSEIENQNSKLNSEKLNDDSLKSIVYKIIPYLTKGDKEDIINNLKSLEVEEILSLPEKEQNKAVDMIYNILNESDVKDKTKPTEDSKLIDRCKDEIKAKEDLLSLAEKSLSRVRFNRSLFKYSRLTPEIYEATNFYIIDSVKDMVNKMVASITGEYEIDESKYEDLYLYALDRCGLYESNGDLVQNNINRIRILKDNNVLDPKELYTKGYSVPAKVYYGKNQSSYAKDSYIEFLRKKVNKLKFFKGTDYEKYLYVYNNELKNDFAFLENKILDDINKSSDSIKPELQKLYAEAKDCYETEIQQDVEKLTNIVTGLKSEIRHTLNFGKFKKYIYFDVNKFNSFLNSDFDTEIIPFDIRVNELKSSGLQKENKNYNDNLKTILNGISSYKNMLTLGIDDNNNKLDVDTIKTIKAKIEYLTKFFQDTLAKLYDKDIVFDKTVVYLVKKLTNLIKDKINNEAKPIEENLDKSINKFEELLQVYNRVLQGQDKGEDNV